MVLSKKATGNKVKGEAQGCKMTEQVDLKANESPAQLPDRGRQTSC